MTSRRSDVVDIARAVAILAMIAYHLIWDLANFGLVPPGTPFTPAMRMASNAIAAAFLALVGLSLVLARRAGSPSGAFRKRLIVIAFAAALTSAASFLVEPRAPILFGILHCIAVASLLAAPLLKVPALVASAVGALAIAAPRIFSAEVLESPILQWIGLGSNAPTTLDWRPLLPWAGCVWLTLGLAKQAPNRFWESGLMRWRAAGAPGAALAWLGRHSLAIYLAHQPILFACLFVASNGLGFGYAREKQAFLATCRPACVESGGAIETCERSCACAMDKEIRSRWGARLSEFLGSDEAVTSTVESCAVEAR